jgi:predicted AAA+ superfamily ATPase
MDDLIARIIKSFSLDDYRPIFKRDLNLSGPLPPKRGNLVTVITGIRRSGKTYRLFQEMDALTAENRDRHLLYFNFEDDRLKPFTPDLGNRVLETFFALKPQARADGAHLFLDEIQVIPDWDIWLRRIVDTEKVVITATGSSAQLLSRDIATAFRGRAISHEMTPYSFREFTRINGIDAASDGIFSQQEQSNLVHLMNSYLLEGGFPAAQQLNDAQRTSLLQDYANRVVATDVVERNNLSNPKIAALFAQRVLASNARELSIRKTENVFKSLGIKASRALLSDLLDYFEDAFLVQVVRPFSRALADNVRSAAKVYAVDPGLAKAVSLAPTDDRGQRLECVIHAELRRRLSGYRQGAIASLRTEQNREVDFVVGDALSQKGYALYQVSESLRDDAVRNREVRALAEAMVKHRLDEATIITLVEEQVIEQRLQNGNLGRIQVLPAWKWCLCAQGIALPEPRPIRSTE